MFRKPGLSVLEAQRLCRDACGALCCQGPQVLVLDAHEVAPMRDHAARLEAELVLHTHPDGRASLRFPDHEDDRCPMLDDTDACRIYDARPTRCRAFPEGPRPGCVISSDET
ncbi:MAG: YkgJ family cysteine cluster protein [Sandaracinaceae bacterium]|nr:YkgJ family cysteine cluster protein [Sandaracinaceae bacterium]